MLLNRSSKIKLFATDIDFTLFDYRHGGIPQANLDAIQELLDQEIVVVFASGRLECGMKDVLNHFRHTHGQLFSISSNGTRIRDLRTNKLIFDASLSIDQTRNIARKALDLGLHVSIPQQDIVLCNGFDEGLIYDRDVVGLTFEQVEGNMIDAIVTEAEKCSVTAEEHQRESFLAFGSERFPSVEMIRSHDLFYDLMVEGCSKGIALRRICEYLNIDPQQVAAIGDGGNDIDMLRFAGFSACVANANDDIKNAANVCVREAHLGGVAEFVKMIQTRNVE